MIEIFWFTKCENELKHFWYFFDLGKKFQFTTNETEILNYKNGEVCMVEYPIKCVSIRNRMKGF